MVKSVWIVKEDEYDWFTGNEHKQTEFSSMQEAFVHYKKRKMSDIDYGDQYHYTRIFHFFVYENEEKAQQAKIREERRRNKEMKGWEFGETRPMTEEEDKASGIREISSSPVEPEKYVFDDDSVQF